MDITSKNLQLQYQGYLNTHCLWENHDLLGLKQLKLSHKPTSQFDQNIPGQMILGKRVERFVHTELQQQENLQILLENIQIQNEKITIGEIDCLLKQDGISIHLEIVYKFYLYDSSVGNTEIEHWIGPNRKDSLLKKLDKLKQKQLPLLYNDCTKPVLINANIDLNNTKQRVLFKAQLFKPYNKLVDFKLLNYNCLSGFYIHYSEILQFIDCKFYLPHKVDWLLEAQSFVDWISYDLFQKKIDEFLSDQRAPLSWIKFPNGKVEKFFVVWWGK